MIDDKLYRLEDGDEVIFIDDKIAQLVLIWANGEDGKGFYMLDNEKNQIFPDLRKFYWDSKKINDNHLKFVTRYYTFALVNNELKLIYFGHKIKEKIKQQFANNYSLSYIFNVNISMVSDIYRNYDNSYFSNTKISPSKYELPDINTHLKEKLYKNIIWSNNSEKVFKFLKDIDFEDIDVLKKITRKLKIERINLSQK